MDAASRRYLLMSFKGMGKSIQKDESADPKTSAPSHLLDEFPAGYSSAGCSPALPASASPAKPIMLLGSPKSGDILNIKNMKRIALKTKTV